ncbi:MAG: AAA family ATPase [Prevotella sp.]|jgi:energy-coupling factor transporter ATP-binding protein EcfA2|nr:AAA family ATPase [Prevotella sp.]
MYISKVSLVNYKNFANAKVVLNKGINTIIGENGSGKTNLFRAIRLLLEDASIQYAYKLTESDFNRKLGNNWKGHWIIISIEFSELSYEETVQSLFIHGTGMVEEDYVEKATYNLFFRPKTDTLVVDLTGGKSVIKDFTVTPLLTIPAPVLTGNPTATEISVNYQIIGNDGNIPDSREIYCSTISWPTRDTGAGGTTYTTQTVTVTDNQGTAVFTGLKPGTRYFIRIGARAAGQNIFNHSGQIIVSTPSS